MAPAAATAKKSRRGTETRHRNRLLNIRLSPEEDARIRAVAAQRGIKMAALLRLALMKEIDAA